MSEYNIQMNKYNALNAEYDQLYPATKIKNVDGLDTALQNKAPAGYGLGEKYGLDITGSTGDANNAKYNGWYTTNESTANLPTKMPYSACKEGTILTVVRGAQVKQIFFDNIYGYTATRLGNADTSVWEEWEYVNPFMLPGVEYRTTERWYGAPVYAQLFDCSPLPNATTKVFPVEGTYADNVSVVVDYGGMSTYYGQSFQSNAFVTLHVTQSKISITSQSDCSAGNAYVWVKYTKSA